MVRVASCVCKQAHICKRLQLVLVPGASDAMRFILSSDHAFCWLCHHRCTGVLPEPCSEALAWPCMYLG